MNLAERLSRDLDSIMNGPAWHGTALRPMIAEIDDAHAHAQPIAGTRSVAELLAHIITWLDVVEQRLHDVEIPTPPIEIDFPAVDGVAFSDLVTQLERAHAKLAATLAAMSDDHFDRLVVGRRHTVWSMVQGLMNHTTYHAAQIAIVKRAAYSM